MYVSLYYRDDSVPRVGAKPAAAGCCHDKPHTGPMPTLTDASANNFKLTKDCFLYKYL